MARPYPKSRAYWEDRARLSEIFPRGRYRVDEDGSCILVALRSSRRGDKGFVVADGRIFGVYFAGRGEIYLKRARDLLVRDLRGEEDGILWFKWDPALARRFPWFCRPNNPGNTAGLALAREKKACLEATQRGVKGPSDAPARPGEPVEPETPLFGLSGGPPGVSLGLLPLLGRLRQAQDHLPP